MNLRGIRLLPVDIYRSDATRFRIEPEGLRPPFNAIAGVGDNAAISIAEKRGSEPFCRWKIFRRAPALTAESSRQWSVAAASETCRNPIRFPCFNLDGKWELLYNMCWKTTCTRAVIL